MQAYAKPPALVEFTLNAVLTGKNEAARCAARLVSSAWVHLAFTASLCLPVARLHPTCKRRGRTPVHTYPWSRPVPTRFVPPQFSAGRPGRGHEAPAPPWGCP